MNAGWRQICQLAIWHHCHMVPDAQGAVWQQMYHVRDRDVTYIPPFHVCNKKLSEL